MQIKKLITVPEGLVDFFNETHNDGSWYCTSEPSDMKLGSGGGTANILFENFSRSGFKGDFKQWLNEDKRVIIHSGGQSRRLPSYSATGKSLIPVPVFRWSKGQYLDQKLLDFQVKFYADILKAAPEKYRVLIGSGDVLFISGETFPNMPEADVLCLGLWANDDMMTRHGVFFSRKEDPESLSFMIQKPSGDKLHELSSSYYYLMDSGIWLMSARAVEALLIKSGIRPGSSPDKFKASFYDLYSTMSTAFGNDPVAKDSLLNSLDVRIIPMNKSDFYHFGSNTELIESFNRIQNRVTDQRKIWRQDKKRHPSIYQVNSDVKISFGNDNQCIWIDNSYIPAGWTVSKNHIITNIPLNNTALDIPQGICINAVPVRKSGYCLHIFGFDDTFRGTAIDNVTWLNRPLDKWFKEREVVESNEDLYEIKRFPVIYDFNDVVDIFQWITCGNNPEGKRKWLSAEKLSAMDLGSEFEIKRWNEQSVNLQKSVLSKLLDNSKKSIFYQLDLKKAASDFRKYSIPLPACATENLPLSEKLAHKMFLSLSSADPAEQKANENEAFSILREEITSTLSGKLPGFRRDILDDQIIWARSPVRIDLAGGWTDTAPYCIFNGGKVVNIALNLNGQPPLQVFARPLEDEKIVLRSIDLGEREDITEFSQLADYTKIGSPFSIPKAALTLAGFGNMFSSRKFKTLRDQLRFFGCGVELTLLSAVPKGSGLGTSSILAGTCLGALNEFCSSGWDKHEISYRTLILEQMLTTGGGWQDQYGAIFPGLKLVETEPGINQRASVKWIPANIFSSPLNRECILLYYTGITRVAKNILAEIVKGMFVNSGRHLSILGEIGNNALETHNVLVRNDYEGLARKIRNSWILNQALDEGTNPPEIRKIVEKIDDYLLGFKLPGAGGGGYMLMFAKDPAAAMKVRTILKTNPPNSKARFVDFEVSETGLEISRS